MLDMDWQIRPYTDCLIRLSIGGDGGEVRRADFGPASLALLLATGCSSSVSLSFSCGKHEDWFCPPGFAHAQEAADGRRAAVGLLLPRSGWVCMFVSESAGNIWKWCSISGMVMLNHVKSTGSLCFFSLWGFKHVGQADLALSVREGERQGTVIIDIAARQPEEGAQKRQDKLSTISLLLLHYKLNMRRLPYKTLWKIINYDL